MRGCSSSVDLKSAKQICGDSSQDGSSGERKAKQRAAAEIEVYARLLLKRRSCRPSASALCSTAGFSTLVLETKGWVSSYSQNWDDD